MRKILITAPLKQDPKIFLEYQESLDNLIIPDGFTADRFFIVDGCPEVIPYIRKARYMVYEPKEWEILEETHRWTGGAVRKMCNLRNTTILMALKGGYDYWLSADTDLVLNRHTVEYLLAANKDIVSEVFWTKSETGVWCNSWMYDDGDVDGRIRVWKEPGLYQVGMTGALMLVKRRVFEAGVGYAEIPNIRRALFGEDRYFCVRAACAGFTLWMDTNAPARHLFDEERYNEWMEVKRHAERGEESAAGDGDGVRQ